LIPQKLFEVCPSVLAALLILARSVCKKHNLPAPDVEQILGATSACRSAAYASAGALTELLPTVVRPRGRPPKPEPTQGSGATSAKAAELTGRVLGYVMRHPGCVHHDRVRQQYSDGFRHFILEQRVLWESLALPDFAAAVKVPLGTMNDWLREPPVDSRSAAPPKASVAQQELEPAHIQTVLDAWPRWHGSLVDFCEHVRSQLLIPFGLALLRHLLFAHGVRRPARRAGRSPDELALRGSFATFFPGAQWVGDGKQVAVVIDDQRYTCNLELNVDAHTAAYVGRSVRNEEDSAAVLEAFADGIATTGAAPLSELLDNRPSNLTPQVEQALGETLLIRATPARPQNKAHVEGGFGLFSRVLPQLVLDTRHGAQQLANSLVSLVATIWAQTLNHRPRSDRGGRSRVELYSEQPCPEQIDQARHKLRELVQRQERARRTLEQRRRPQVLALLLEHFTRLNLLDPLSHFQLAIAAYPLAAIVAGLAIFSAKLRATTLPQGADARYLLGIVRNLAAKQEGEHTARALLELRLEVRDRMLAPLCAQRDALLATQDLAHLGAEVIDLALGSPSPLVRLFWLDVLAARLALCPLPERGDSFRRAARRIYATFSVSVPERGDAVRLLAERLLPIS
jgi:hypothetical protein